jgi:hypothetical protein
MEGSVGDAWAVRWVGAQRDVLAGDVSGKIDLRTLASLPQLYTLEPREGLQGEVTVFDGRPSASRIVEGRIAVDASFDHHACFLVFATMAAWDETALAGPVRGVSELEVVLAEAASGSRSGEPPSGSQGTRSVWRFTCSTSGRAGGWRLAVGAALARPKGR